MQQGNTGFRRIINAAGYSWKGLRTALRTEAAFRQELGLFMILFPVAIWLGRDGVERAVLVIPLFIVVITELLNTGVEYVVDRIGSEHNKLSGRAKDVGSAAVFISLWMVPAIWIMVLFDRF